MMKQIKILFIEGGPVFMYSILLLLIIILCLFILGLFLKQERRKIKDVIISFGWIAFVTGFLEQAIGLYDLFDFLQMSANDSTGLIAGGIKLTLLPNIFGLIVFIVSRLEAVILILIHKNN